MEYKSIFRYCSILILCNDIICNKTKIPPFLVEYSIHCTLSSEYFHLGCNIYWYSTRRGGIFIIYLQQAPHTEHLVWTSSWHQYSRKSLNITPRKGHCIKYLSTMDKTKSPNYIPPINIMRLESLKEDNVYTGDKPLEFILVPKCPLFRDSTVYTALIFDNWYTECSKLLSLNFPICCY